MADSPPEREQNFYPLARLSFFRQLVDDQLEHEKEQFASLQQAESKPYILDDATVQRLLKLYSEAPEIIDCYTRQCAAWKQENPTQSQRQEIQQLEQQVEQLQQYQSQILSLAKRLEGQTIDQLLGKSDLEIGLDFLSGLM